MIHWNAGPEILRLGNFAVRWYGVLFAAGFLIGQAVLRKVYLREKQDPDQVDSLFIHVMLGTLIGARLGHTLFYEPGVYLADPLRILRIWEGGLASHGAALGVFIGVWLYCRKTGLRMLWVLDRLAIVAPLAGALIRVGNFFNSEILGKPSSLPWAVIFESVDSRPRHPAQLYESLAYLAITAALWAIDLRTAPKGQKTGLLFGLYLALTFTTRFLIEFLKENQATFESALPLNMGQLLSIPFIAAGVYFIARARRGGRNAS